MYIYILNEMSPDPEYKSSNYVTLLCIYGSVLFLRKVATFTKSGLLSLRDR